MATIAPAQVRYGDTTPVQVQWRPGSEGLSISAFTEASLLVHSPAGTVIETIVPEEGGTEYDEGVAGTLYAQLDLTITGYALDRGYWLEWSCTGTRSDLVDVSTNEVFDFDVVRYPLQNTVTYADLTDLSPELAYNTRITATSVAQYIQSAYHLILQRLRGLERYPELIVDRRLSFECIRLRAIALCHQAFSVEASKPWGIEADTAFQSLRDGLRWFGDDEASSNSRAVSWPKLVL